MGEPHFHLDMVAKRASLLFNYCGGFLGLTAWKANAPIITCYLPFVCRTNPPSCSDFVSSSFISINYRHECTMKMLTLLLRHLFHLQNYWMDLDEIWCCSLQQTLSRKFNLVSVQCYKIRCHLFCWVVKCGLLCYQINTNNELLKTKFSSELRLRFSIYTTRTLVI